MCAGAGACACIRPGVCVRACVGVRTQGRVRAHVCCCACCSTRMLQADGTGCCGLLSQRTPDGLSSEMRPTTSGSCSVWFGTSSFSSSKASYYAAEQPVQAAVLIRTVHYEPPPPLSVYCACRMQCYARSSTPLTDHAALPTVCHKPHSCAQLGSHGPSLVAVAHSTVRGDPSAPTRPPDALRLVCLYAAERPGDAHDAHVHLDLNVRGEKQPLLGNIGTLIGQYRCSCSCAPGLECPRRKAS